MGEENKGTCYLDLLKKIDLLDMQVKRIKNQLTELKSMICEREETRERDVVRMGQPE
jgi:hypothetical protein